MSNSKVFRVVQVEVWRRVYEIEADSPEGAAAVLAHVRPNPVQETCESSKIVQVEEKKR